MKLYIIIGEENSRKSSTIRALTGAWNTNKFKIAVTDQRKEITIYVKTTSFQEANRGVYPNDAIIELTNCGCDYALICLWKNSANHPKTKKIMPDYAAYIKDFIQAGFSIQFPKIFLEKGNNFLNLSPDIQINNINKVPSNEIASIIRTNWNFK
jgi:hypothetical protein